MAKNPLCEINRILGSHVLRFSILLSFRVLFSAYSQEILRKQPDWKHHDSRRRGRKADPDCFDHRKIRENLWSNVSNLIHFSVFYHHAITMKSVRFF